MKLAWNFLKSLSDSRYIIQFLMVFGSILTATTLVKYLIGLPFNWYQTFIVGFIVALYSMYRLYKKCNG